MLRSYKVFGLLLVFSDFGLWDLIIILKKKIIDKERGIILEDKKRVMYW